MTFFVQKLLALKISSFEGIFRAKRVAQCVGGIKVNMLNVLEELK